TSKKPLDIPSKNILDSVSKKSLDITKLVLVANFKQIIAMCIEGDGVFTGLQPTARVNTCR
ncbi:hypothetical protein QP999_12755, partial [Corynebacterium sp. MSK004]|uniref:hypothetical protein n=1 Tax=Corynebacterium sp. MSK004 TaxID=3050186 RepID=UPI00254D3793